jgi:hypothetical protein
MFKILCVLLLASLTVVTVTTPPEANGWKQVR